MLSAHVLPRSSAHSANLRLAIDGIQRMAKFMGDGLIRHHPSRQHRLQPLGPWADHPARFQPARRHPGQSLRPRRWKVQLLFDADHSLEERIIAEQFLS
jgi:hypothetical protein